MSTPDPTVRAALVELLRGVAASAMVRGADPIGTLVDVLAESGFNGPMQARLATVEKLSRTLAGLIDPKYGLINYDNVALGEHWRQQCRGWALRLVRTGYVLPAPDPDRPASTDTSPCPLCGLCADGTAPPDANTDPASMPRVYAPWDTATVTLLNAYQSSGLGHPFTCGHSSEHVLIATAAGWVCPRGDGYTQNWAHAFMRDLDLNAAADALNSVLEQRPKEVE